MLALVFRGYTRGLSAAGECALQPIVHAGLTMFFRDHRHDAGAASAGGQRLLVTLGGDHIGLLDKAAALAVAWQHSLVSRA